MGRPRTALSMAAVAVAYYAGASAGLVLRFPPATTSVMWPPNAILTAILLLTTPRCWWMCLAAVFPAHLVVELQAGLPLPLVLALFATNCSEALIAATAVVRLSDDPSRLDTLNRAIAFLAGAVFLATILSSFLDAAVVFLIRHEPYGLVLRRRILSSALGELTIVPTIVVALNGGGRRLLERRGRRLLEVALFAVAFGISAIFLFTDPSTDPVLPGAPYTSLPVLMPFLIFAALRFGTGGASTTLLATSVAAIGAAVSGRQPFGSLPPEEATGALQVFILVVGVPLLLLGSILQERRRTAQDLQDRLDFEELLSRLAAAFVNPPSERLAAAVAPWLRSVGEAFGLTRVTLHTLSKDARSLVLVHGWPSDSGRPNRLELGTSELRELVDSHMGSPGALDAPFPRHAVGGVRVSVADQRLDYPLSVGPSFLGVLTFEGVHGSRFSEALIQRGRLVADVMASALARRQTEDALRDSEFLKSAILASLENQVAVLDQKGHVMAFNESWARLLPPDRAPRFWAGARFDEVWAALASAPAHEAEDVPAVVAEVIGGTRSIHSVEFRLTGDSGRWFTMTVVPLRRGPSRGAVVSLNETTERRYAEADATRMRQELAHFLRVSTVGELTTALAHQLNQPLAAILANAQAGLLLLHRRSPSEIAPILADIIEDDKRAGEVIARLRELLKKGDVERTSHDLNDVVGDVSRLLQSDALIRRTTLRFERESAAALPVLADRVQIQQVLLNLIVNAMEAVADSEEAARVVQVRVGAGDDGVATVSVCDAGPGLQGPVVDRVFEPFFTTKPRGMGMGLAIARSIVEAHGGSLTASRNPDRGATFTVVLPVTAAPSA